MYTKWLDRSFTSNYQVFYEYKQLFTIEDIQKYIEEHYPNEIFDMNKVYVRLFHLSILNHLNVYGENYECLPFVENVSYIPERFINYVSTPN